MAQADTSELIARYSMRRGQSLLVTLFLAVNFIFTFVYGHPLYMLALLGSLLFIAYKRGLWNQLKGYLVMVAYISLFMFAINVLLNPEGAHIIARIFPASRFFNEINITTENLLASGVSILRLSIVIFLFGLFNALIDNDELIQILLKLRLPYKLVLLITLSLKFFPLLSQDYAQLEDYQKISQGDPAEPKGTLLARIRRRVDILLPLLTNSLERSLQIAQTLEVRAFGLHKKRSVLSQFRITGKDVAVAGLITALIAVQVVLWRVGMLAYSVYPQYQVPFVSFSGLIISLGIFAATMTIFALIGIREGDRHA